MTFLDGPSGPAPLKSSFRSARRWSSVVIALGLVFFFLSTFRISIEPRTPRSQTTKWTKADYQPASPLHSGLSDPPPSYLDFHDDAWSTSAPLHTGLSDALDAYPVRPEGSDTSDPSQAQKDVHEAGNDAQETKSGPIKITQEQDESGSKNNKGTGEFTTTVVVGRVDDDPAGVDWIKDELKDVTRTAIYIVDDPDAPLHLNKNKGREAMVYMKYIMQHYYDLSDVTIFFHSSQMAWHNNIMAFKDGSIMINNLQRKHVIDVGYFNLRCELYPGCPKWIKFNPTKEENRAHAERFADLFTLDIWDQMFPNRTHTPDFLAQPCCSQFAVSKEKIRSIPLETFVRIHDFLAQSRTSDGYLGRIMEYVWQFLFMDVDELCPPMPECYRKGYGVDFSVQAEQHLIDFNNEKMNEENALSDLGQWDLDNCGRDDGAADVKECKKKNPFGKPLSETRKKATDHRNYLQENFGMKNP